MKVALVYDRINKFGGAERVLLALHRLYPDAPLFTAVYDRQKAPWAADFAVRPSGLNRIPFVSRNHEFLPAVTPMAFESFDFSGFDLVISVTSAEAKSVITKPGTLHICYLLTPTRYLWSGVEAYRNFPGLGIVSPLAAEVYRRLLPTLREWDTVFSRRPDYLIPISETVAERVRKYYGREPQAVIYPPADNLAVFTREKRLKRPSGVPDRYALTVARFVGYKRIDLVIGAMGRLGIPLVVVGRGRDEARLRQLSRGRQVVFVTRELTDAELASYYNHTEALVFAGEEDFGIVAAEAQLFGKPVISKRNSGMAEVVLEGKTGYLFDGDSEQDLMDAYGKLLDQPVNSQNCRENARRFSESAFRKKFQAAVTRLTEKYKEEMSL